MLEVIRSELKIALTGELAEAFILFFQKIDGRSPKVGELTLLSGRYNQAKSNFNQGLILIGERDVLFQQVRAALLDFIERLNDNDLPKTPVSDAETAKALGLQATSASPLHALFANLRIDWKNIPISHLHLVNCDRVAEFKTLKYALRERWDRHQEFQYYFINACPMQRPESFSERVILEIIHKLDEEEQEAILVHRKPDTGRIRVDKLPFDFMGLAQSKKRLAKYFEERFDYHEPVEPVEEFLRNCVRKVLDYQYIAFVFSIDAKDWEPFFPEYIQWIMDTFDTIEDEDTAFLFFFPVWARNLHEAPTQALREIADAIQQLGQAHNAITTVISPLTPVVKSDIGDWFTEFGEADTAKIDDLLMLTLQREKSALTRLDRFLKDGKVDMYDVEALQEEAYRYAMK
jgi:inactive STAND